jgi:hypothetical protein
MAIRPRANNLGTETIAVKMTDAGPTRTRKYVPRSSETQALIHPGEIEEAK